MRPKNTNSKMYMYDTSIVNFFVDRFILKIQSRFVKIYFRYVFLYIQNIVTLLNFNLNLDCLKYLSVVKNNETACASYLQCLLNHIDSLT